MEATLDKAGRLVIPKVFRDQLGLTSETPVDISLYGNGLQITPGGRKASLKIVAGKPVATSKARFDDDLMYTLMDSARK